MDNRVARILKEGLVAGLVAYGSVVLVLGGLDAAQGESFFRTAAAMGTILFYGAEASGNLAIDPGPILAYNGVHLLGSLVVGTIGAVQIVETEEHRDFWYVALTVLIAVVVYSITVFGVFGVEIGGVLDWTSVVVGTAAWILPMTGYFWWVHRGLLDRIQEELEAGG